MPRACDSRGMVSGFCDSVPNRLKLPVSVIVTVAIVPISDVGRFDLHRLQIGRLADDLARIAAGLLEQHVERLPDAGAVEGCQLAIDQLLQFAQAFGLHVFRNLIVHVGGRRAGARRILERERAGEADLVDQLHGVAEIRVGFAGEADDEIGGEGELGLRFAQAIDDAQIIVAGVVAVHRVEDAVGARLHRQMQLRHQFGQVAMRGDQAVVDVARMARGVAQPVDAGDFRKPLEQSRKRPGAAVRCRRRDRR